MSRRILKLTIFLSLIVAIIMAGTAIFVNSDSISWNHDANTLVVRTSQDGQTTAAIYGDGTLVWLAQDENGHNLIQHAQITEAKLRLLLGYLTESGFFEWQPAEQTARGTCLTIQLESQSRTVCAGDDLPTPFYQVVEMVASGVGETGEVMRVAQMP